MRETQYHLGFRTFFKSFQIDLEIYTVTPVIVSVIGNGIAGSIYLPGFDQNKRKRKTDNDA